MAIGPSAEWAPLLKGNKFNVLAVSTANRDPRFPEIPTFKEFGFNVVIATFNWVAAPAGTPDDIINFLAEAFKKGFAEQAFKDAADNLGAMAAWASPQECTKTMEKVDELYQRIIKKYDLKTE